MKNPDIVVKACGWFPSDRDKTAGFQIVRVPNKYARREYFARGDMYSRRMFHSNQHGKFINGYRVEVLK